MIRAFHISGTSPAVAGTTAAIGNPITGVDRFSDFKVIASLVGATGGALDVYLQWSPDGATWYDYAHFPQLAAAASAIVYSANSSFAATTPAVVGSGITPALAANVCVGGSFGTALRCIATAGASTSAGAAIALTVLLHAN